VSDPSDSSRESAMAASRASARSRAWATGAVMSLSHCDRIGIGNPDKGAVLVILFAATHHLKRLTARAVIRFLCLQAIKSTKNMGGGHGNRSDRQLLPLRDSVHRMR
jgi:hypothetical protein